MKFDLLQYMSQRYEPNPQLGKVGPVVTISRQYGCSAKEIAKLLSSTLKERRPELPEWRWVNKEIFESVAKELEVSTDRILHVFEGKRSELAWDIFRGFTEKYYKSDATIKKTLVKIIKSIAEEGNNILIGLGSAALLQEMPNALHIRLIAPEKWRLEQLNKSLKLTDTALRENAKQTEQNREKLRNSYTLVPLGETAFDVTYNRARMSSQETVDSIIQIMTTKGMI